MKASRKKFVLAVLIPILAYASACLAEETQMPGERITLSSLVKELLQSNPDVYAASLRYRAAEARPSQEGALPDPRVRFGWMSAGSIIPGRGIGSDPNANIGLQISQMFPFPGKLGLQTDTALKEADAERQRYGATVRNRIAVLKSAYYELVFVYESTDLLKENLNLLDKLAKVAEARYSVGQAMQQDLIKASTEMLILENRLLIQEQKKRSLTAEINSLLNRPAAMPLARPEKTNVPALDPYDVLRARLKDISPLLLAQQTKIESRDLSVRLAQKEYYPDFDVMGGYYHMGELTDMWELQFSVNIPIWFKKKQRKQIEEATLELSEAKQSYRATEQMLEYRLQDAYAKAETANKLVDLYAKQIVPQSRLALESSLASYETGNVDFLTVLSNFMTILEYRIGYSEQQAEYLKALAVLEELSSQEVQS